MAQGPCGMNNENLQNSDLSEQKYAHIFKSKQNKNCSMNIVCIC